MATRMQQRKGTEAQWISTNSGNGPILNAGEIGYETDTNKFKIGDGINHWVDLNYFADEVALGGSIDDYIPLTQKGANSGVATLDSSGKIPSSQIPDLVGLDTEITNAVNTAINNLVDGAPSALNTLNEIAAAIDDDASYAATITSALGAKITAAQLDDAIGVAVTNLIAGAPAGLNTLDELAAAINDDPSFATTIAGDLSTHTADTTSVHGIEDTAELATKSFAADLLTGASKTNITITGDKNGLTITAENGVADSTTDNLSEGSTNKYFTDERAQDAIGNSIGTGLSYNDSTGAISVDQTVIQARVTDVSDTEIGYLNGVTSAIQTQLDAKAPLANPTFTGTSTTSDLVVNGDFTVNGTNFSASATSITIEDNMVQLAHQNAANTVDLGLVVAYNDGAAKHAGIVRDVSDSKWKLFKDVTTEPSTTVAFGEGSLDALSVGAFEATSATISSDTVATLTATQTLTNKTLTNPKIVAEINPQTASYTLVAADASDFVEVNSSSGTTVTVPTNSSVAYPVGTVIHVVQTGTGQITVAGAGGVTVNGTPGLKLRAQWSAATLVKRATDTWVLFGDLTS